MWSGLLLALAVCAAWLDQVASDRHPEMSGSRSHETERSLCNGTEDWDFKVFYKTRYVKPRLSVMRRAALANYDYTVDMSPAKKQELNRHRRLDVQLRHRVGHTALREFNLTCLSNPHNRAKFRKLKAFTRYDLNAPVSPRLTDTMAREFSKIKICPPREPVNCSSQDLWPLREKVMPYYAETKDEKVMRYLWLEWRRAVSRKISKTFLTFLYRMQPNVPIPGRMANYSLAHYAIKRGFPVVTEMEKILSQIRPFYQKLHALARYRLSKIYPDHISESGTIPAHLLGRMYSQDFHNMYEYLKPCPDAPARPNATQEMADMGWTADHMARVAERFFRSIGFPKLPDKFWQKSVFVRPKGRKVMCHPTAVDIGDGEHFMIRMCAKVDLDNLDTIHHELGHIYYYIAYSSQPLHRRAGASPAFHEGIGDAIYLSAAKTSYLQRIGLMANFTESNETELNELMEQALKDIPFIPSAYIYDKWKYDVMDRNETDGINEYWWELRRKYQGLHRPDDPDKLKTDNDASIIDPISKYHVAAGIPYSRYFFSRIFTYMTHKALCNVSQPGVPLHECSIAGKKEAGDKLWNLMKKGSSVPWQKVLKEFTGYDYFSTEPLLEYYKPLIDWLNKYIVENNIHVGWDEPKPNDEIKVEKKKSSIDEI